MTSCQAPTSSQGELVQVRSFVTGFEEDGLPRVVPSIDPAGLVWHDPTEHLFIVDSEIDQIKGEEGEDLWDYTEGNLFEVSVDGTVLYQSYDLIGDQDLCECLDDPQDDDCPDELPPGACNQEPTGISWSSFTERFYVSNDDRGEIVQYQRVEDGEGGYELLAEVSTQLADWSQVSGLVDLEDICVDPLTGVVWTVVGEEAVVVAFTAMAEFELVRTFAVGGWIQNPEGIAVDPVRGHLMLVSSHDNKLIELTTEGTLVAEYSMESLDPAQIAVQGLSFGPPSDGSGGEVASHLYMADGGIDNSDDETERDGRIFEVRLTSPEE